jgi:hypothetical protein
MADSSQSEGKLKGSKDKASMLGIVRWLTVNSKSAKEGFMSMGKRSCCGVVRVWREDLETSVVLFNSA